MTASVFPAASVILEDTFHLHAGITAQEAAIPEVLRQFSSSSISTAVSSFLSLLSPQTQFGLREAAFSYRFS